MAIFNHLGALTGDEALAAALTSDSPTARIMARGAAATWMPGFVAWANDELNRPKVNPVNVLYALALMQMQIYASLAAQVVRAEGSDAVVEFYVALADKELRKHMDHVRQQLEALA